MRNLHNVIAVEKKVRLPFKTSTHRQKQGCLRDELANDSFISVEYCSSVIHQKL